MRSLEAVEGTPGGRPTTAGPGILAAGGCRGAQGDLQTAKEMAVFARRIEKQLTQVPGDS